MPKVKITVAAWGQPGKGGRTTRRKGEVVDVTDEQAKRLIKIGAAKNVRETKAQPAAAKDTQPESPKDQAPATPEKPKPTATKGTWAAYAVSQGMDAQEADALTRDELAAHYAD